MALGFTEHVLQGWWGDGQLWVLVKSNSRYNVNIDGTELSLIGGEKPIPTAFDPNGYNTVKLVYDPAAKTAELWINAVRVMGPTAVPNGSDGLPPAIHYAGWSAMNASLNETGVDDFDLSVGAGSVKMAFDGDGFGTPGAGAFPRFDFLTTTASSEAGAPASATLIEKATTGTITYTWTPLDALESATTPEGTVTYTYDGDGLRIKKTNGNDEVIYIRDGAGQITAEYDGQGHLLAEYVYAMGHRIARISASGMRFYYHTDNVGTPLAITDQNGNLSWRGEYLPFGTEFSSTDPGDDFKFTGKELEDHTGLYYFEARYYDPVIGRFISVDPVGGNVGNSQSWNRYSYALNNPVALYDPDGEAPHIAIGALAGGIVGGGIEAIRQYRAGDDWNIAKIGTAAGQGMAVGAVAAATGGTSLLVAGAGVGTTTAVTGVAGRALDMDSQTAALDVAEVSADFAGGAVGGAVGFKVGQVVTRNITNSQTQRALAKQADRWVRRVQNRSPSRQANALANSDSVASRPADWGRRAAGAARGGTAAASSTGVRHGVQAIQNMVSSHRKDPFPMASSH